MNKTAISWTHLSANPLRARDTATGKIGWHCVRCGPDCDQCYAASLNVAAFRGGTGHDYEAGAPVEVFLDAKVLRSIETAPAGRRIFVCSMSDPFGEFLPEAMRTELLASCCRAAERGVIIQLLTKRPALAVATARALVQERGEALPRCLWLGMSAGAQHLFDPRWAIFRRLRSEGVAAGPVWLSYEPAIGPLSVRDCGVRPQWIVVGGESGAQRRPFDAAWLAALAAECLDFGIPLYVKQGSHFRPGQQADIPDDLWARKEFPVAVERQAGLFG